MSLRTLASMLRDRRGTSAIEFALIAPVLALFMMGIADLSLGLAQKYKVEQASYRVLEMVTVGTLRDDYSDVEEEAAAAAGEDVEVDVDWWLKCAGEDEVFTEKCGEGEEIARYVRVELKDYYEPIFDYGPLGDAFAQSDDGRIKLIARSTVRIQ